jgi:hypothetical protein
MSVVISSGNCEDGQIPFRAGRKDATGVSPFDVPAPDTSLETTLGFFSGASFNRFDAIQLTASGHILSSVHHSNFSAVVPESATTISNTAGGIRFDSTPDMFDDTT